MMGLSLMKRDTRELALWLSVSFSVTCEDAKRRHQSAD